MGSNSSTMVRRRLQLSTPDVATGSSSKRNASFCLALFLISNSADAFAPPSQLSSSTLRVAVSPPPPRKSSRNQGLFFAPLRRPSLKPSGAEKIEQSPHPLISTPSRLGEDPQTSAFSSFLLPQSTEPALESSTAVAASLASPMEQHQAEMMTENDKFALAGASIAAASAFLWLVTASGPGAWRFFLAGGSCAALSHMAAVPIDVVKTMQQVDPQLQSLGLFAATKEIIRTDGFHALLAGMGPTGWGYLLEGALKFGVYEVLKPVVKTMLWTVSQRAGYLCVLNTQLVAFLVSGAISGLAASLVLCPAEALRIRMVAEPDFAPDGFQQGINRMLQQEGFSGLTRGIKPMILKQVPYTIVKNVSFDYTARYAYMLLMSLGFALTPSIKFTVPLVSAGLASILACLISQPGDMLLSLMNAHGDDQRRMRDVARDILRTDRGIRGFFVGVKTRLVHVGMIVTLQLFVYDMLKRVVGIAATGCA